MLKAPTAADWVIDEEGCQGDAGQSHTQHEVLWKQLALHVAKCVTRQVPDHGQTCTHRASNRQRNTVPTQLHYYIRPEILTNLTAEDER